MELAGKRVLVTGASSGIGADLARELCASGANVVLAARRLPELEALRKELERASERAAVVPADLSTPAGADALASAATEPFGGIDILVNNAGVELLGPPWVEGLADKGDLLLQVNLASPLRLMNHLLPAMLERKSGALVFISSIAGWTPLPGGAYYSASKAGLARAAEAVRIDLRDTGVHVLAVYPGPVKTPMLDRIRKTPAEATFRYLVSGTSTELARRVVDGLVHDEGTLFYPAIYRTTSWFMGISRWVARVTAASGKE